MPSGTPQNYVFKDKYDSTGTDENWVSGTSQKPGRLNTLARIARPIGRAWIETGRGYRSGARRWASPVQLAGRGLKLTADGHIKTSYQVEPGRSSFTDNHRRLGYRLYEFDPSDAQRADLERLFGPR
jgi:hypothetical protein